MGKKSFMFGMGLIAGVIGGVVAGVLYAPKSGEESRRELSEVFGEGSIKGFVWPYSEQKNKYLVELIKGAGYLSVRKTGEIGSATGFVFPEDRMAWTYNATNASLLSVMKEYENLIDDGNLKFFAFGVHSWDFERDENWCDLEKFAEKYGNRPTDYYYATVSELFEYEDAANALVVSDNKIINNSDITLFVKVCEKKIVLHPHTETNI